MTGAGRLMWTCVTVACALQRRAVKRQRGSFFVTSQSEPMTAQMVPGKSVIG